MNAPNPCDLTANSLLDFIQSHPRLFVLTGAGISTDSGIPDYRDADGEWKHQPPVRYEEFLASEETRQRYWARSLIGWPRVRDARPNAAHQALARLETAGHVHQLLTQNVDGLHQRSGSRRVIDLHGRLDTVVCLDCRRSLPRAALQARLSALNPDPVDDATTTAAPDGDVHLDAAACHRFRVPACPNCGGLLKPQVVFFGETIPRPRVERAMARLADADALLVVGSSLMVFSGYRFCRAAAEQGKPIAAVNLGRTRADDLLTLKVRENCAAALERLARGLGV